MDGKVRRVVRAVHRRLFGARIAEKEKADLRRRLMDLPLGPDHPFDLEAKLLRSIGIRPAMLDIGANTGIYSAALEDLVGAGELYLFEPLEHLQRQLRQRFRKARVLGLALSDAEGTGNIRVPYIDGTRYDTRASLNDHAEPGETGFEEVPVRFLRLDSIAAQGQLGQIGFIKIDVEGHEMAVLKGAEETLSRYKPLLLVEIEARHHSFPITEIFSRLEQWGYTGLYVDTEQFELRHVSHFDPQRDQNLEHLLARNPFRYRNNFFFVHEEGVAEFSSKATAFLETEQALTGLRPPSLPRPHPATAPPR